MFGVEDLLAFVDLQSDADVPAREHRLEMRSGCHQQRVAGTFVRGSAAAPPHAQVEVDKRIVGLSVGHRKVCCRVGQHAGSAGGEDLDCGFILYGEQGVGQATAQRRHIGLRFQVGRVEDDEMGHGLRTKGG